MDSHLDQLATYDQFLMEIQERIDQNPEDKHQIVWQALQETICPYLKEKIQQLAREA